MSTMSSTVNYFGQTFLDRMTLKRNDAEWLSRVKENENTVFILFHNLQAVVHCGSDHTITLTQNKTHLLLFSFQAVKDLLKNERLVIFLGIEKSYHSVDFYDATHTTIAWFAVDVSDLSDEDITILAPQGEVTSLFPGSLFFDPEQANVYSQARSLLDWHDRYKFCPTCGSASRVDGAGYRRICVNKMCRSHIGAHNTSRPRIDPTVIMAVTSPDNNQLLLADAVKFPHGVYSCLSGFLEPGETLEGACIREVYEETGIEIGNVQYHSCQPWPIPTTLMIGCIAHAKTMKIKVDKTELRDARWFTRSEVLMLLNGTNPDKLLIPPEQTISNHLIRSWFNTTSRL